MSVYDEMLSLAEEAKAAAQVVANLSSGIKNELLLKMADALESDQATLQ